jgi:hypothetical protein
MKINATEEPSLTIGHLLPQAPIFRALCGILAHLGAMVCHTNGDVCTYSNLICTHTSVH